MAAFWCLMSFCTEFDAADVVRPTDQDGPAQRVLSNYVRRSLTDHPVERHEKPPTNCENAIRSDEPILRASNL